VSATLSVTNARFLLGFLLSRPNEVFELYTGYMQMCWFKILYKLLWDEITAFQKIVLLISCSDFSVNCFEAFFWKDNINMEFE